MQRMAVPMVPLIVGTMAAMVAATFKAMGAMVGAVLTTGDRRRSGADDGQADRADTAGDECGPGS